MSIRQWGVRTSLGVFVLAGAGVWGGCALGAEIRGLGVDSDVRAISADGKVAVGGLLLSAFRWTEASGLGLLYPPGEKEYYVATAVSGDGSVIAGNMSTPAYPSVGFRWAQSTGIVPLAIGTGATEAIFMPGGISRDGSVIGGHSGSMRAYRWTTAGVQDALGALGDHPYDYVRAVSGDGNVVVGQALDSAVGTHHAYRWTPATGMVQLDAAGAVPPSNATAISGDGTIIVGTDFKVTGFAFRWTSAGGFVALDPSAQSAFPTPRAVSDDGSLIAGEWTVNGTAHAFVWDPQNTFRSLDAVLTGLGVDVTGWQFNDVVGVSADGTALVGHGVHNGQPESFYVSLVPEPAMIGGIALLPLLLRGRRRH